MVAMRAACSAPDVMEYLAKEERRLGMAAELVAHSDGMGAAEQEVALGVM